VVTSVSVKPLLAGLNAEHVVGVGTYIDDNLSAAEGQVRTREMFSDLGSVHALVISDPRHIQRRAVGLPTAVDGLRTELLDIQPGPVRHPPHCAGIADKNFELVELNNNNNNNNFQSEHYILFGQEKKRS
jgi:hypothetical protein